MSILCSIKNNSMHVFAGIFRVVGVILAALYFFTVDAVAGCGYVDVVAFPSSATYKFVDGGYNGFSALAGSTVADCYAETLKVGGQLGDELLLRLHTGASTTLLHKIRGPNPSIHLNVAHRGGPDWANGIPDNSIAAFQQSISKGVSSVEVDLQMDSKRNLIVFHDTSFADMVQSSDSALLVETKKAISDYEWITKSDITRKFDDTKLSKLNRVIPNAFKDYGTDLNNNPVLKLKDEATLAKSGIVVSSLPSVLSAIQTASQSKFGTKTGVNIFLDAAKSRDITIAAINRLRRSHLVAEDEMYNDVDSALSVPLIKSIAVQFRINHFPGGADDLAEALCNSIENKTIYKKSVVVHRVEVSRNWLRGYIYRKVTYRSYQDSTDGFVKTYGETTSLGSLYHSYSSQVTGKIHDNGNPSLRLWGDAASNTCYTSDIVNSGIALVPVVEETLPYKVSVDSNGNVRDLTADSFAAGVIDFLTPFKNYFKMNIIEFSYTPLDTISHYLADLKSINITTLSSQDVQSAIAISFYDSVYPGKRYIYQTFNRFFDVSLANSSESKYNGQYLCSSQLNAAGSAYEYLCKTQLAGSSDEQKFEYRSKPGLYNGICNSTVNSAYKVSPFGLTTTDNPLLEIYLNGADFFYSSAQTSDFCTSLDEGNRMSSYTKRYKSFVGNPSFRLSGGI